MKALKMTIPKGLMLGGILLLAASFFFGANNADAYTFMTTMRQGSRGAEVMQLQQTLNSLGANPALTVDGVFGSRTATAVRSFQASRGLAADGVVGPNTRAALNASAGGTVGLPTGCLPGQAFNATTGQPCTGTGGTGLPAGCMPGQAYSTTTGQPCTGGTNLPAGCTSTAGYSATTGVKCDSGTGTNTGNDNGGPLQGGSGSIDVTQTSVDTVREVIEGRTEKVLGFRIEAQDSDVRIDSVRVSVENTDNASNRRPDRYLDSIEIWRGNTRVGSVDAADLTRDSGNVYSRNITLSDAIVREGSSGRQDFYVVFRALANVDSGDMSTARFTVSIDNVRFTDASGATLNSSTTTSVSGITFTDLAGAGEVRLRVSASPDNPKEQSVQVNEFSTTNDIDLLDFQLNAESSDMTVQALSVDLTSTGSNLSGILSELRLMRGSTTIADYSGSFDADMSQRVRFDLYDDLSISQGDNETLRVVAKLLKQQGNFVNGATIRASLSTPFSTYLESEDETGSSIENFSGSAVGYEQTLFVSGATIDYVSSTSNQVDQTGQVRDFILVFDVTAVGDDITVDRTALSNDNNTGVQFRVEGAGTNNVSATLSSNATLSGNTYTVFDGQTRRFTLTVTVTTNTTGQKRIVLEEVAGVPTTARIESVAATVIAQ